MTAIKLTWNTISGATHYDLRRWNGTTNSWDSLGGNLTGNSYQDPDLTSGAQYWYVMRAVNAGGNGPWSSSDGAGYATVILSAATTVPKLTADHQARETVVLTWTQVADGAQYDLQRMSVVGGANRRGIGTVFLTASCR